MYEIAVIGGGITGALILRELSRYTKNIILIEKENDVANAATMANSAIIHAGFDPKPGTHKAFFNVRGNRIYPALCLELDILFRPTPSIVVAFSESERQTLLRLLEQGKDYGVPQLEIIERQQLRQIEPNISNSALCALYAGSSAIIEPWGAAIAAVENAVDNGAQLLLSNRVTAIERSTEGFFIHTDQHHEISARTVINTAGAHADEIHDMVAPHAFSITGRKGHYFVLDRNAADLVQNIFFPCPNEKSKGILITPVIHDKVMIGPDSENTADKDEAFTDSEALQHVRRAVEGYLKFPIPMHTAIRSFAGIRPTPDTHDFVIGECDAAPGFFDAAGIESPGLASAPAIAQHVAGLVRDKLSLRERPDFQPLRRRQIRFAKLPETEQRTLVAQNSAYAHIVCKCERITEAEIVDAIHRSAGARTVKAVKKRTGAGFGRCQSGFCQPGVIDILSRELHIPKEDVLYDKTGSNILTGRTKI